MDIFRILNLRIITLNVLCKTAIVLICSIYLFGVPVFNENSVAFVRTTSNVSHCRSVDTTAVYNTNDLYRNYRHVYSLPQYEVHLPL